MTRPKGSANVSAEERERIRELFRAGMKLADIVESTGRSMSVVQRATRGLKRKRPSPPIRVDHSERDNRILELAEDGLTRAEIGAAVGLRASRVGSIIAAHPHVVWLLCVRKVKPATVAARYRLELATAQRIAKGADTKQVPRSRQRPW
ncbi:MAG: hypothetical protein ACE37K_15650 [Planctomycetota bacterium]